jgi:hypothetical protein
VAVTIDDIKAVYPPARDRTAEEIQPFLDTALMVVNEQLRPNCSMTADRYDKITVYLTAHFMSISDSAGTGSNAGGALRRSKLGEADESYDNPTQEAYGYNFTRWGQMAIALDTCGILIGSTTNRGLRAEFRVVGGKN